MKKILFKHIPYDWAMFVGYFWMIACFLVSGLAFFVYLPCAGERTAMENDAYASTRARN